MSDLTFLDFLPDGPVAAEGEDDGEDDGEDNDETVCTTSDASTEPSLITPPDQKQEQADTPYLFCPKGLPPPPSPPRKIYIIKEVLDNVQRYDKEIFNSNNHGDRPSDYSVVLYIVAHII